MSAPAYPIPKLIAITPPPGTMAWEAVAARAAALATAGLPALMLRDHETAAEELTRRASWLKELTEKEGTLLIVNRRLDVARAVGARGVQVGAWGPATEEARAVAGDEGLVGYSAHAEDEALGALARGADYVTFSPVFATESKPEAEELGLERLRTLCARAPGRVIALGGLDAENYQEALAAGAQGVAMIGGLFFAKENADRILRAISRPAP